MTVEYSIKVSGLKELRAALNEVEKGLGRELAQAGKRAADIVARTAASKVPVVSGRARDSLRAVVSQGGGGVREGGGRAPYAAWLDFGGRVGRHRSVSRPRVRSGRYVYPALAERREQVRDEYEKAVAELLKKAGLT